MGKKVCGNCKKLSREKQYFGAYKFWCKYREKWIKDPLKDKCPYHVLEEKPDESD